MLRVARVITSALWPKKAAPLPRSAAVSNAGPAPAPPVGFRAESVLCATGFQLVRAQLGAGGWQQIGMFTWDDEYWSVPGAGSLGLYLLAHGSCSQAGLTSRVRLVVASSLLEVEGSFLALASGTAPSNVKSPPLLLEVGLDYMIQAECAGSDAEEAFAATQAAIIVRQSF